jgi:CRISPR/Cas system-associated exonuclease Cas4 (RecB family)
MTSPSPFEHWRQSIQPKEIEQTEYNAEGLPPVFQFSQNNLQDYADCARRFQLRYVEGQRWPAVENEPLEEHEKFMEQGSEFHLLVQRHLLGVPADQLSPADPLLAAWWDSYLRVPPPDIPSTVRVPETQLSTPLGDQRLLARFDLLAIEPGQRAVIVDWKTTRHRPKRETLAARLQTRLYPFVLAEAGAALFGGPITPDQISLIYWFAEEPGKPEEFIYNAAAHEANREYLSDLIAQVLKHKEEIWPLTDDLKQCDYCVYRSLCNRGVTAGDFREIDFERDDDFNVDLDGVEEIAF